MVQFYPRFNFCLPLFCTDHDTLPLTKFEPQNIQRMQEGRSVCPSLQKITPNSVRGLKKVANKEIGEPIITFLKEIFTTT